VLPPVVAAPLPPAAALVQFPALVVASGPPPGVGNKMSIHKCHFIDKLHQNTEYNMVWPDKRPQEQLLSSKLSTTKTIILNTTDPFVNKFLDALRISYRNILMKKETHEIIVYLWF